MDAQARLKIIAIYEQAIGWFMVSIGIGCLILLIVMPGVLNRLDQILGAGDRPPTGWFLGIFVMATITFSAIGALWVFTGKWLGARRRRGRVLSLIFAWLNVATFLGVILAGELNPGSIFWVVIDVAIIFELQFDPPIKALFHHKSATKPPQQTI